MNDEDAFQAHLDAHPDDHTARMVFADWLDEQGDPRGSGYRALGMLNKMPIKDTCVIHEGHWVYGLWFFHSGLNEIMDNFPEIAKPENRLPAEWVAAGIQRGRKRGRHGNRMWMGYQKERRQVEDIAAIAFSKLSPEYQAEILSAAVV